MAKAAWNRTIVDASGNVLPGADITVTDERTGTLATLFDDREGNDAKSNPFVADSNGFARFFAEPGVYRVVAESGALSRTWRFQSLLDNALDITWTGEQTFTDKVTMTDELEVTGNADITGNLEIDGDLEVTGDATMQLMSWYPRTRTVTGNTTATADDMVINVNTATATITIPSGLVTGKRILVRKIHATQGAVTLARTGSDTFTRAGLTSVTLNADGDFWLIEKVSSTRWELVDGFKSGQNSNGNFRYTANNELIQTRRVTGISINTNIAVGSVYSNGSGTNFDYPVSYADTYPSITLNEISGSCMVSDVDQFSPGRSSGIDRWTVIFWSGKLGPRPVTVQLFATGPWHE